MVDCLWCELCRSLEYQFKQTEYKRNGGNDMFPLPRYVYAVYTKSHCPMSVQRIIIINRLIGASLSEPQTNVCDEISVYTYVRRWSLSVYSNHSNYVNSNYTWLCMYTRRSIIHFSCCSIAHFSSLNRPFLSSLNSPFLVA